MKYSDTERLENLTTLLIDLHSAGAVEILDEALTEEMLEIFVAEDEELRNFQRLSFTSEDEENY